MRKGEGTYNLVIIGAGTAGLVTAAGAVALGARVALIERHKMGGDCLNFGCVPSKALISSARLLQRIRDAKKWGIEGAKAGDSFGTIFASMRAQRAELAPHDSVERFESLGVDVFLGEASFVSPKEVVVEGQKLRAKNFVIATGTRAALPRIEGLGDIRYFTNETIFDELVEKPDAMLILGGGPIGCELAQAFSRLGAKITLLQRSRRLLEKEDQPVSDFARERLEA
ncbi:MAG: FAD-dependent oxidoreductase, partial [Chthoniobacterales bacterium]|nr:FAD-dependent oxidoreductase [Chthoniobacterales bacterium]